MLRRAPDGLTAILASLVLVFATALVAERFHASPVIAVVVAGLMVGNTARTALDPSRFLALEGFWETVVFTINVVLFLLVGMQIEANLLIGEAPAIALALVALHVGRAVAVYGTFGLMRMVVRDPVPMRWQHVMVFGNIKGALSMAAAVALPAALPYRERIIHIVFGVTFVTLITQALPFKKILEWLGVVLRPVDLTLDRAQATLIAARRGQADLEALVASGLISRRDHAERRAAYQREVIQAEEVLRRPGGDAARGHVVDASLLIGRKAAILDATRQGLVSPEVADEVVGELDRKLMHIAEAEEEHG